MHSLLQLAEDLWTGRRSVDDSTVVRPTLELAEVAPGVAFVSSFANAAAIHTEQGLALVDTGSFLLARTVHTLVREWRADPLHTAVFTHGHVDHCFGVELYEEEQGAPAARVVGHKNILARFDRYARTAGYNGCINQRQFRLPVQWPTSFRRPEVLVDDALVLQVGSRTIEVHHALGETDDALWAWLPAEKVLCTGDLVMWVMPNAGNPQKVQRYAVEWAVALRKMAALGAEVLLPGHGFPVLGAERVRQVLSDAAELLESLVEQTLALMNQGAPLDTVLHSVRVPSHLEKKPYLQPVYDEPEFIVRNLWRRFGGWWDGNAAHLKPGPEAELAREFARAAGGAKALADRALELLDSAEYALACHLAETAAQAAPYDKALRKVAARVYRERAERERSLMAKGIYTAAAERWENY